MLYTNWIVHGLLTRLRLNLKRFFSETDFFTIISTLPKNDTYVQKCGLMRFNALYE